MTPERRQQLKRAAQVLREAKERLGPEMGGLNRMVIELEAALTEAEERIAQYEKFEVKLRELLR